MSDSVTCRFGDSVLILWMADQQGSFDCACGFEPTAELRCAEEEKDEAVSVASEPELVLRLISAVVAVVLVVVLEVKLRLWRSSARSSSHGSIAGRRVFFGGGERERVKCEGERE